jgi:serine O-acetyltransferase
MSEGLDLAVNDARSAEEMPLAALLEEDFVTHERKLLSPGFWALVAHRLGSRSTALDPVLARSALRAAHKALSTAVDWTWGIHIPLSTRVGRRVHIWHFGSMLLNAHAIGNDVQLRHDTTFGPLRSPPHPRPEAPLPVIEDAVDIGPGACVLGGVTVGHGAKVGANTVVIESVPPHATVFGVPARVIP